MLTEQKTEHPIPKTTKTHLLLKISHQPERLEPRALMGGAEKESAPPVKDCCLYAALETSSRLALCKCR